MDPATAHFGAYAPRRRARALLALCVLLASCEGPAQPPLPVASQIIVDPETVSFDSLGESVALAVEVRDQTGAVMPDVVVEWLSLDESVATVSDGVVTSVGAGETTVEARAGQATADVRVRVLPELTLVAEGPGHVTAEVATTTALFVRVEDGAGAPVVGATVRWEAAGDGSITSASVVESDVTGHAGAAWLLGTTAGSQVATATVETHGTSVTADFTADAVAAPAAAAYLVADSIVLSGRGETAFLGPTFEDPYGNPASPVAVTWTSRDPAVATVATDGLVTAAGDGAAWLTGELGAGVDSILVTVVSRGAITITFDDGWLTTYTQARAVMDELGLRGNVGVYTEAVDGGYPAYMTTPQLQELHDAGWTLVSHTVSHDTLTSLSDAALDAELRDSHEWLVDHGFERGSDILIVPYHEFGERERIAASRYYLAARGASANAVVPDSMVFWQPTNPYELTGIDVQQLPYTTVAGRARLRALLQRTRDEGRFLDVFFHQVPPDDVDALRETLAVVDEFRDRVLPYHELYPDFARTVR